MKIGIDISQIVYRTGVSQYTRKLIESLLQIDSENEYLLFAGSLRTRRALSSILDSLKGAFTSKIYPIPPRLLDVLWNRLHFIPIESLTGKLDVVHSSDWTEPPSRAFKVTTVHDLAPILYPNEVPASIVSVYKRRLYWVKREVDRIIVPSTSTKDGLLDLGFAADKIRVVPEANVYKKASSEAVEAAKRKYKISDNYMLAVGVTPRKNIDRIVKAFETATAGTKTKLVIVGQRHGVNLGESHNIRFTGRVESDSEMQALYSGASLFLYPSLYEGFGLPILDAFACGVPVVTSSVSSMPEVAGDAAIIVDPLSVTSIAQGIREAQKQRKELVSKGKERLTQYSWEHTAKETLKVYEEGK